MSLAAALASAYGASPRGWAGFLSRADFIADLLYTAVPQRAASGTTATFTRATTSTWKNNDGYLVTGVAGEIGFVGARREYNQISNGGSYKSEGAFNSWTKAGVPPTVTDGIAGPDGRLTAARVVFAGSGAGNAIYTVGANGTGRTGIVSAQIRGDAAGTIRLLASNSGAFIDAAVTTEWQRFTIPAFAMTNTDGVAFLRNDVGQLGTIYVADAMIKDVTAQTTQTAGEYVSVGVESAPYYHGSFVDGVKCYATDINGSPIPSSTLLGYQAQGARTNHFLQSGTPATQTSGSLSTGTYTLWMDGTGSIAVAGATATITGAGTATSSTAVTFVVTVAGTVTYTVTGSPTRAQSENGAQRSSYIATTTIAVTRNKDEESVSTSGNIAAAAGSIYLEYTPTHAPSGTVAFWGTYVDADNYTAILHDATNLIFRKRIAGVNYDATIANAFVSGTTYKACATWGASGTSITLNGTEGTPHANTTAAQIGSTMQWGADGNSLQQPFAYLRNCRDWLRQLSASERVAVTV